MGDKSPKSVDRKRKQDTAEKNQKKADAYAKAHPDPPEVLKKPKQKQKQK